MPFSDKQLSYLNQFGFDPTLLDNWRKGVQNGWYSQKNNWVQGKIHAPDSESIDHFPKRGSELRAHYEEIGRAALAKGEFGVVILNGGMATRFGGVVKGTVPVLGKRTFLELKAEDIKRMQDQVGCTIPVFLMNSFATEGPTQEHCVAHGNFGLQEGQITHFNQFISVRMTESGHLFTTDDGNLSLYGPGHGDFAPALRSSGCLDKFIEGGGKYLFLSNVDNLGARVSPIVLGYHIEKARPITVEVTPKWPGDVGGSPFIFDDNLQLIEQVRYPKGFDPDIVDVFNTNTFTFTAEALREEVDLGWYYVAKTVDGRKAIQMEHLVGEMTQFFDSNYLRVKRSGSENRFLPVKTPADLDSSREEISTLYP